jgi:hypothetical protein
VAIETLVRLGSLLSPSFFAILAGLSLTAAGLLFVAGRCNAAAPLVEGSKLSGLEPPEYRATGYLVLAFGWSMFGLVLGFIFAAIGARAYWSLVQVILSLPCLIFTLCFLYAGGVTLLHAVTGQKGRLVRWPFPPMRYIDILIVQFGDLLTAGLLGPSWSAEIATKIGGPAAAVEEPFTTAMSGREKEKLAEEMKGLHARLAEYEAHLTPEQKAKLMELRGIVEELKSIYL